jgi:outer membrane protein assembly factor BamB
VRAGGLLYTPNGSGSPLSVVDAATGRPHATVEMRSHQDHPPVVAGGRIYVTNGEVLRAYY